MSPKKYLRIGTPILLSIIILLILFFPHYYAAISTPEDMVFSGHAFWFDPWDINVYIAAIKWAQSNGFNFQNAYTTQAHNTVIIYPLYTTLGALFPNAQSIILFHISSLVLATVFLFTIYKLSKKLVPDQVNTALFLIPLAGGLGWLFSPIFISPDVGVTPFTFVNTLQRPHETIAMVFYLSAFYFFYKGAKKKKKTLIIRSGFFASLLIFFYPFHLLSYYVICGCYALIIGLKYNNKTPLKNLFIIAAVTLPIGVFYSLYLLKGSRAFTGVFSPNIPAPNLVSVALGYGVLVFFIVFLLFQKKKDDLTLFLTLWFFLSLLFVYLPFGFAKQYLRGLFFPAVILSLISLGAVSKRIKISKTVLLLTLIVLVPLSGLFIFRRRILDTKVVNNRWYYITKEEKLALDYLDKTTPKGSGVIASYILGNHIPAHTENRVYFGHDFQTPNSKEKIKNLTRFYENEYSEEEARQFLIKNNISYVVWGPDEKNITLKNVGEEQLKYTFLERVYSNSKVTIFSHSE